MTLNYTLSKSLDIGSRSEGVAAYSGDFMINSWNAQQLRARSRYDALHQANAFVVYQLPLGRGTQFGSHMNRVLDAVVGGWEVTGTWRQTSGLPFSVSNGTRWATNWELSGYATPNGNPMPAITSPHNAPAVSGRQLSEPVGRPQGRARGLPGDYARPDRQPQLAARRRLLQRRYGPLQELHHALERKTEASVPVGGL